MEIVILVTYFFFFISWNGYSQHATGIWGRQARNPCSSCGGVDLQTSQLLSYQETKEKGSVFHCLSLYLLVMFASECQMELSCRLLHFFISCEFVVFFIFLFYLFELFETFWKSLEVCICFISH